MSAVETRSDAVASYIPALERRRRTRRWGWRLGLAAVLLVALGLRLWGIHHGLPYAYNADENAHFLPRAIGMFGHQLDPGYYVNPPAYTYVLYALLSLLHGGRLAVGDAFATDPGTLWTLARATSAVLGTVAVGLLYLAGRRLAGPAAGLLAAGLLAVAFLPVFYSHLALNDVPTLAPLCLALWGAAGVLRDGRDIDYAVAGIGLGLAAATKYTGGIVLLALLAAAVPHGRAAVRGLALAGVAALVAFVAANPYAVIDPSAFLDGLSHQSDASADAAGKLGLTEENGWLYYLWSFGWGVGWVPLVTAAVAIPVLAIARRWTLLAFLAPAPVLFVAFMGSQERFFGRWLMPVLPFVCLLAAIGAVILVTAATRRAPGLRPTLAALAAVALLRPGARVLDPRGPGALARRHAGAHPRLARGERPGRVADRRGARRRPRRVGAGHRQAVRRPAERQPLGEVPDEPLADRPGHRARAPAARHRREHRGLREDPAARAGLALRARGVLLGRSSARRSAAARRPSRRPCRRRSSTTRSSSAAPTSCSARRRTRRGRGP